MWGIGYQNSAQVLGTIPDTTIISPKNRSNYTTITYVKPARSHAGFLSVGPESVSSFESRTVVYAGPNVMILIPQATTMLPPCLQVEAWSSAYSLALILAFASVSYRMKALS